MTIEEAQAMKNNLEFLIQDSITIFESETGLSVDQIDLRKTDYSSMGDKCHSINHVTIHVGLQSINYAIFCSY